MPGLTLSKIVLILSQWGYILIFPIAILEGPIIAVIAGFLASLGQLDWFIAYIVLMLGDFAGDGLYYGLGRWGHGPLVERIISYIGVTPERLRIAERGFRKHDWKILLINKTQAIGSVVLYFAGAIRMPFWRFMFINIIGSAPKIAFFEIIGYYFGQSYAKIQTYLDYAGVATLVIPLGLLVAYFLFRRYARSREDN